MKAKKITAIILALLMIMSCLTVGFSAAAENEPAFVRSVVKNYNVAPGVTEQHITTCLPDGSNQVQSYIATIDMNNESIGFLAGYDDYSMTSNWNMRTVRDQAKYCEQKTGKNIVVAVNADYFNMSTGCPLGALVMDGNIVHETWGEPYFAILNDGSFAFRDSTVPLDDVKEAVGSPFWLVRNGAIVCFSNDIRIPTVGLGRTADNKLIIVESDGRQAPKSVGYTYYEFAQFMQSLGCVDALYYDGGGSATFASKTEGTSALTVKNSPSDGTERKVSSTMFIYSDAKPSGEFDHASLLPNADAYTPGSTVEFSAVGVDSAGTAVALPENGVFALAQDSAEMGEITPAGVFTSNGTLGTVEVNYVVEQVVKGSTQIDIVTPDTITFANEEVSLGFETESDLGVKFSSNNRDVICKDGDFDWTITDVTDLSGVPSEKVIGAFNGNTFISCEKDSLKCKVTCTYKDSEVSGSVTVIVGQQPTVVMDFEDKVDELGTVTQKAEDYWANDRAVVDANGGNIMALWNAAGERISDTDKNIITAHYCNGSDPNNSRGGNESAEIVSISSGEPVRFGNYSLKLNYDFRNINGIEGACVGFSQASQQIPGNPTAIGMYVYVPENTPNLWLRIRFRDGTGQVQTLNFTDAANKNVTFEDGMTATDTVIKDLGGINWTGWKYVETSLVGYQGPFTLLGGETVRLMHTFGAYNGMGNWFVKDGKVVARGQQNCVGSIYIDNVQFVYGANTDDIDNPVINSISVNNAELKGNDVITSNNVNFSAVLTDVQNKYTSGVDFSTVNAWIDGRAVEKEDIITDSSKDSAFIYDRYLVNGVHTIKFLVRDKFGNETVSTKTFTVDSKDSTVTALTFKDSGKAYLGEYSHVSVETESIRDTKTVKTVFSVGGTTTDCKVSYATCFEQLAEPVYDEENGTYTVSAKLKDGYKDKNAGTVFTVSMLTDKNAIEGSKAEYSVKDAEYTVSDGNSYTFILPSRYLPVTERISLEAETMILGFDATAAVKDENGKPVPSATVYDKNSGVVVGTTDENGVLVITAYKDAVNSVSLYAETADGDVSFVKTMQVYGTGAALDGAPTYVKLNAVEDSQTEKNITWMSNPSASGKKAIARVALKSEYDEKGEQAFVQYEGESELLVFGGSSIISENKAVYSNSVYIKGLANDSEYVYSVGDGVIFSDTYTMNTHYNAENTKFFIIGDTQAENKSDIASIISALAEDDYTFGVQTGDFVEKTTLYDDWNSILDVFNIDSLKSVDIIHCIGNHELFGDANADIVSSIFNVKDRLYYSATYGNVFVAVLGYSANENEVRQTADRLVADAAASDAKWKIVVSHQPPYGSNEAATDCDAFHAIIPEACDAAGIDFVFSGHDHALAVTNPVIAGEADNDGTIYYICGSTGEKSYTPSNTRGYPFKTEPTNEFGSIYFTVDATNDKMTVKVMDLQGGEVASFGAEKTREVCAETEHSYIYRDAKHLVCEECGNITTANDYNGLVKDEKTGLVRRITAGEFTKSAWMVLGDDSYYFNAEGYAVTGTVSIDGIEYTFGTDGKYIKGSFVDETVDMGDGTQKLVHRYYQAGGKYALRWLELEDGLHFFKKVGNATNPDDGNMYKGGAFKVRTPGKNSIRTYTFDENGVLIKGAFDDEEDADGTVIGTRYYWGGEYLTGEQTVDGVTYTLDENGFVVTKDINECDITLSAENFVYTGNAVKPTAVVKDGDMTLISGTNYKLSYKNNKNAGTATVTVTGVASRGYTGSKTFDVKISAADISKLSVSCASSATYTGKEIKPAVTVKDGKTTLKNGTDYTVSYKNNTKLGTATVTVKGKGNYTGTVTKKFTINPVSRDISKAEITLSAAKYTYNGKAKTPSVTVKTGAYTLINGTDYSVKYKNNTASGKATVTITGKGVFTGSKSVTFTINPAAVGSVSAKAVSYNKVKLSWSKVSGCTGYRIYKSSTKNGTYKLLKTVKAGTTSYTDTVKTGKANYYKVCAYKSVDKQTLTGAYSKVVSATAKLAAPTVKKTVSGSNVTLKWDAVDGATGYTVYAASKQNGTYKKVATLKSSVRTYTGKANMFYKVTAI